MGGGLAGFCLPRPTTRLLRRVCKDRQARGGVWCCNDGGVGCLGEEKDRQKRRRLEEAVRKVEVGRREGRQRCSKGEVEGEKKAMRGRGGGW